MDNNLQFSEGKNLSGQAATELAVFGSVLIFVLTAIITTAVGGGYSQNMQLKAMRKAMTTSFEYSEGLRGYDRLRGTASRNTASILLVEDRLSSSSAKYGSVDRIPFVVSGTATASRNLFLPIDPWETQHLPYFDLFVNGKHFPLTTAAFGSVSTSGGGSSNACSPPAVGGGGLFNFYTMIANGDSRWCDGVTISCTSNLSADERFDLNRCSLDRAGLQGCPGGPVVPVAERPDFGWQWYEIPRNRVPENESIDLDRDLKEERVIKVDNNTINYIDAQRGDVDFTINDSDLAAGRKAPGFSSNSAQIYTTTGPGTYLEIDEGRLYVTNPTRQYIRTANRKDQIDFVERIFQMSNNTGRFCPGGGTIQPEDETNPVDVCCSGANCCYGANMNRICFNIGPAGNPNYLKLYIRSAIVDRRGRKWITDTTSDDYVDFVSP
jgi:hypothetical protein